MESICGNRSRKKEKGQSLVEFTLMTPLLLAALMVVADFGVAFYMGNLVAVAARDGARIGSELEKTGGTGPEPDFAAAQATKVRDYIQTRIPRYLNARQIIVTFYEDDAGVGPPACSESIQVQVSGNYPFTLYRIMNFFGSNVPSSINIVRSTRMRYTYQRSDQNITCTSSPNVNSTNATYDIPNA